MSDDVWRERAEVVARAFWSIGNAQFPAKFLQSLSAEEFVHVKWLCHQKPGADRHMRDDFGGDTTHAD